jgi:hypothetical protein
MDPGKINLQKRKALHRRKRIQGERRVNKNEERAVYGFNSRVFFSPTFIISVFLRSQVK